MRFEFATATRILFGPGTRKDLAPHARALGSRALVVAGRDTRRAEPLIGSLAAAGIETRIVSVPGEPTTDLASHGAEVAREFNVGMVIGIGGGSVIDAGKAMAALATNRRGLSAYLEVIGQGQPLDSTPLPFFAVPTTAGTGAEVTRNAVLASPEHRVKVSLRSPLMLARLAVVDPELTAGLPRALSATTGLDALTQLIEPLISCRANPLTDAVCREGLTRAARSLRRVCEPPENPDAREDMALASLCGGLALANAGLGAVHGFAAPIGGLFPAPHGAVCAALLPHALRVNLRALRQRQPASPALERFAEIARILTGEPAAQAEDGITWVAALCRDLDIPRLRSHGLATDREMDRLIENAAAASSMKGNPLVLTAGELREILQDAV